jgi:hypothetical protein
MNSELIQVKDLEKFSKTIVSVLTQVVKTHMENGAKKEWLPEREAMKVLDVSKSTIQNYRRQGLLAFSQHGSKIMYKHEDLMGFLNQNYVGNSSKFRKNDRA